MIHLWHHLYQYIPHDSLVASLIHVSIYPHMNQKRRFVYTGEEETLPNMFDDELRDQVPKYDRIYCYMYIPMFRNVLMVNINAMKLTKIVVISNGQ